MLRENFDNVVIKKLGKRLTKELKKFINKVLIPNSESEQHSGGKIDRLNLINSMGLSPTTFDLLMKRDHWSLGLCLWIANEVGFPINIKIGKKLVNIIPF